MKVLVEETTNGEEGWRSVILWSSAYGEEEFPYGTEEAANEGYGVLVADAIRACQKDGERRVVQLLKVSRVMTITALDEVKSIIHLSGGRGGGQECTVTKG